MVSQFTCFVDGCEFTAEGESEMEVFTMAQEHVENNHSDRDVSEEEIRNSITRG